MLDPLSKQPRETEGPDSKVVTSRQTFFIRINTQFDNLGDALINRELIQLLGSVGQVVVDVSSAPQRFRTWIDVGNKTNVHQADNVRDFWSALARALRHHSDSQQPYLILNPGGYIGEITAQNSLLKNARYHFYRSLTRLGCRFALIGASYEALGPRHEAYIRRLSSLLTVHAVRDTASRNYCISRNIRFTHSIPDLAFNLEQQTAFAAPREASRLTISMRDMGSAALVSCLADMARLFHKTEPNGEIDLVYQVERDEEFQLNLAAKINMELGPNSCTVTPLLDNISSALAHYSTASVVISNRLHVLLLAFRAGAVPIALATSTMNVKIRGVFADIGMSEYLIDLDQVNGELLFTKIISLKQRLHDDAPRFDAIRALLQDRFQQMW